MGTMMSENIRPFGADVTLLPPPNTQRWVKSRKLAVIQAIENGVLSDEDACKRYSLSEEELQSWKIALKRYGPGALRTTHINRYRKREDAGRDDPPSARQ